MKWFWGHFKHSNVDLVPLLRGGGVILYIMNKVVHLSTYRPIRLTKTGPSHTSSYQTYFEHPQISVWFISHSLAGPVLTDVKRHEHLPDFTCLLWVQAEAPNQSWFHEGKAPAWYFVVFVCEQMIPPPTVTVVSKQLSDATWWWHAKILLPTSCSKKINSIRGNLW